MITDATSKWVEINERVMRITHPDKVLWPDIGLTKWDYILHLTRIAPFLIRHASNRLLTTIRFPEGIERESFYQKNIPSYAPDWIERVKRKNTTYILLNRPETLIWLANQACLEFHVSFSSYHEELLHALVFDLDPNQCDFSRVAEAALIIRDELQSLALESYVKTSGATGLQLFVPVKPCAYEQARQVNHFFAAYFQSKYPHLFTLERLVKKRGRKVYFDYLQMWRGKSLICAYSPRARPGAPVSVPLKWSELESGIKPEQFHLQNIHARLEKEGDLFLPLTRKATQSIDPILEMLKVHS